MTAQHPFTYAGDTALVSGAASGIGRATAATLASAGLTVLLLDRDGDGAIAAAAELGPESPTSGRSRARSPGCSVTGDCPTSPIAPASTSGSSRPR